MVGKTYPVLFEEMQGEWAVGHAPNYVQVRVAGEQPRNAVIPVRITGLLGEAVTGVPAADTP